MPPCLDYGQIHDTEILLEGPSGEITGSVIQTDNVLVFTPGTWFVADTDYQMTVSLADGPYIGDEIAGPVVIRFHTAQALDRTEPHITDITPRFVLTEFDDNVSITGSGFEQGAQLSIGGEVVAPDSMSVAADGSSISVIVLQSDRSGWAAIEVRNPDGTKAKDGIGLIYVTPLEIHAISPDTMPGEGGLDVTVSGSGFAADSLIWISYDTLWNDEDLVPIQQVVSGMEMTFVSPAGPDGYYNFAMKKPFRDPVFIMDGIQRKDVTPPQISGISPYDGSMARQLNTVITVTFSEPMDKASFTPDTLWVEGKGITVDGDFTFTYNDTRATFTPFAPLDGSTCYHIYITEGVTDRAGNPLPDDKVTVFCTVDTSPPFVDLTQPEAGPCRLRSFSLHRLNLRK